MEENTPKKITPKTKNYRAKLQVPFGSEASSLDFPTISIGSIPNLRDCNRHNQKENKMKKNPNGKHNSTKSGANQEQKQNLEKTNK